MNWDDEDKPWRSFEPAARDHLGNGDVQPPLEPELSAAEEPPAPDPGELLPATDALWARLERIERALATLDQRAEALQPAQGATLPEALASLEKQIGRVGREQFKATTLAEAQRDQVQSVLDALRAIETQRQEEGAAIREGLSAEVERARLEVAQAILPALDGLDEALRSGRRLAAVPSSSSPGHSWFRRTAGPAPSEERLRADLQAWLLGLEFVRERLLGVLAAEGITVIPAQGLPFDPQIHLAVEVSRPGADTPEGSITAVIRQGYQRRGRIVRPAEVAVARAE